MMLNRPILILIFCLLPCAARADFWNDAWLDPALLEAHDLNGGSGFIHVPAPQSLADGLMTGGIHSYQVEAGRGFPYGVEAGGLIQLDGWDKVNQVEADGWNLDNAAKENLLYFRWSPLTQGRHSPIGLSFGWEGVGMQDLGFKLRPLPTLADMERHYVVAGGVVPDLPMLYVAGGYGGGEQASYGFGALAFAPFAGLACMAEYNDKYTNLGVRILLSTQIKLDLDLCQIQDMSTRQPFNNVLQNNVVFGVSYSEVWP